MRDITVLQLGSKSLVGKDTFFNTAKEYGFIRVAFADKLKNTVMDLYNFSHEQMYGNLKDIEDTRYPNTVDEKSILKPEWADSIDDVNLALDNGVTYKSMLMPNQDYKPFFTPRRILQIFGQQQRLLFPDIWAAYIFSTEIPRLVEEGHTKFIVTDFRFKNEAQVAMRWKNTSINNKLYLIKINRDIFAKSGSNDISEHDLDDFTGWNFELNNNSTLENYNLLVKDFILTNFNK